MEQVLKDYLEQSWLHKLQNAQVCMSNDNDGVITSSLLKHEKGWETNQFYDYEQRAVLNPNNNLSVVAVDCGATSNEDIHSIDNHLGNHTKDSRINPNSINLNLFNRVSAKENYTDKYAMSTLLMCYVALGKSLPSSELGKMILIAIDVGYKGFYKGYNEEYLANLEQLGLKEELLPILEKYTFEDFVEFHKTKLGLGKDTVHLFLGEGELWVHEDMLEVYEFISQELGFPVEIPKGNFTTIEEYDTYVEDVDALGDLMEREDIGSWAYINSRKVSYSKRKPKRVRRTGA